MLLQLLYTFVCLIPAWALYQFYLDRQRAQQSAALADRLKQQFLASYSTANPVATPVQKSRPAVSSFATPIPTPVPTSVPAYNYVSTTPFVPISTPARSSTSASAASLQLKFSQTSTPSVKPSLLVRTAASATPMRPPVSLSMPSPALAPAQTPVPVASTPAMPVFSASPAVTTTPKSMVSCSTQVSTVRRKRAVAAEVDSDSQNATQQTGVKRAKKSAPVSKVESVDAVKPTSVRKRKTAAVSSQKNSPAEPKSAKIATPVAPTVSIPSTAAVEVAAPIQLQPFKHSAALNAVIAGGSPVPIGKSTIASTTTTADNDMIAVAADALLEAEFAALQQARNTARAQLFAKPFVPPVSMFTRVTSTSDLVASVLPKPKSAEPSSTDVEKKPVPQSTTFSSFSVPPAADSAKIAPSSETDKQNSTAPAPAPAMFSFFSAGTTSVPTGAESASKPDTKSSEPAVFSVLGSQPAAAADAGTKPAAVPAFSFLNTAPIPSASENKPDGKVGAPLFGALNPDAVPFNPIPASAPAPASAPPAPAPAPVPVSDGKANAAPFSFNLNAKPFNPVPAAATPSAAPVDPSLNSLFASKPVTSAFPPFQPPAGVPGAGPQSMFGAAAPAAPAAPAAQGQGLFVPVPSAPPVNGVAPNEKSPAKSGTRRLNQGVAERFIRASLEIPKSQWDATKAQQAQEKQANVASGGPGLFAPGAAPNAGFAAPSTFGAPAPMFAGGAPAVPAFNVGDAGAKQGAGFTHRNRPRVRAHRG